MKKKNSSTQGIVNYRSSQKSTMSFVLLCVSVWTHVFHYFFVFYLTFWFFCCNFYEIFLTESFNIFFVQICLFFLIFVSFLLFFISPPPHTDHDKDCFVLKCHPFYALSRVFFGDFEFFFFCEKRGCPCTQICMKKIIKTYMTDF